MSPLLPEPPAPPEAPVVVPADVPETITLKGLVLRRLSPADTALRLTAVSESFDHLNQWLPDSSGSPTLESERKYIDDMTLAWTTGEKYAFGVFDGSSSAMLGSAVLHNRVGPEGMEIGYWTHAAHTGRGIAATCAAVLTDLVLSLPGRTRVEIHCDEANTASAAVPRRLGYRLDRTQAAEVLTPAETGRLMIWIMDAGAFPGSAAERRARAAVSDPAWRNPDS